MRREEKNSIEGAQHIGKHGDARGIDMIIEEGGDNKYGEASGRKQRWQ